MPHHQKALESDGRRSFRVSSRFARACATGTVKKGPNAIVFSRPAKRQRKRPQLAAVRPHEKMQTAAVRSARAASDAEAVARLRAAERDYRQGSNADCQIYARDRKLSYAQARDQRAD